MTSDFLDLREHIIETIDHLDHILPGQRPLHEFVHHNTIHGFQHLPFEQAVAEYEELTGVYGYLPDSKNRELYQQGRITDEDLAAAFSHAKHLNAEETVLQVGTLAIKRKDIYRMALIHDLPALSISQLNWFIEELNALNVIQPDVSQEARSRMLATNSDESAVVKQLWQEILNKLGIELTDLHPENMLDLSEEQAREWLEKIKANLAHHKEVPIHQKMRAEAEAKLDEMLAQIGDKITLRSFVMALSGIDILFSIRPQIIRICASVMDEGVAAWQLPERSKAGLYAAWRSSVQFDVNPFLHDLSDWQRIVTETPEDPVDCIIMQLSSMEIPQDKWEGYIQHLALELPGWSGMVNWRQHNPEYHTENNASLYVADYLAIRLTLDRLWLNQTCKDNWKIEAKLGTMKYYFRKNLSEFIVRKKLYGGELPEYLTNLAKDLILRAGSEREQQQEWQALADLTWTWQFSPLVENNLEHTAFNSGWRLFRLFQHLGLTIDDVQSMHKNDLLNMLTILDEFTAPERSKLWLYAYEYHYREGFFRAINANVHRGRWAMRVERPQAQIVTCMDDREESMRRQLEEINPAIETLGAAGFFGTPMNYKGIDDTRRKMQCPVVVTPSHDVDEIPRAGAEQLMHAHSAGNRFYKKLAYVMNQSLRRGLIFSHAVIDALAPIVFIGLLSKIFLPKYFVAANNMLRQSIEKPVPTRLMFTALEPDTVATPEHPRLGFTDVEQADKLSVFMRTTGLSYGFAPIVCLIGHGSTNQNNPHAFGYNCGACSGKRGGPNARLFAAMANRPEVRALLAQRNINIPEDTWFVGAEHDTCSDEFFWYDLEDIPENKLPAFEAFRKDLVKASKASAHERCRRFASARNPKTPEEGKEHVYLRSNDFSQAFPEYNHATIAAAIVGRRSVSQGTFLDRRVFLISYDPTQDADGKLLENLLLAVGPVGSGINLEYYFSTINNDHFGSGSKITHNITGMFGVIEGTSSDLRTGLTKQMVEIHEPLRLQVMVEAKNEILGQIYERQAIIRELVGGGWILLSTIDPDTGAISVFERGVGFVPWQTEKKEVPEYDTSIAYYQGSNTPLSPVLIKQPNMTGV
ncbi:MAG TPA: DUF2309 domain-containing protein [Nitrosomonas sp.]|nr:DUF2309 domain-containing protein [Nitrosomonas sp.]